MYYTIHIGNVFDIAAKFSAAYSPMCNATKVIDKQPDSFSRSTTRDLLFLLLLEAIDRLADANIYAALPRSSSSSVDEDRNSSRIA